MENACLRENKLRFIVSLTPQFLLETKHLASIQDSSWISALCDLQETYMKKIQTFESFFINFSFFEMLQLGKKWV